MNHPLDGARFKIVRAKEHLDALKVEVGNYLNRPRNPVRNDYADGRTIFGLGIADPPPLRISAIAGDVLTNSRAPLDYIAYQLAVKFANFTLVPGRHRPKFHIAEDPGSFDPSRFARKYSIPDDVIGHIESVQPYHGGYEPFGVLHALVNEDKHRLPLLTVMRVTSATMRGQTDGPITMSTKADEIDLQITGFVTFQNVSVPREPIDRTLEQIIETVANVIPRFDRFF
jgi:hypothetical protein